MYCKQAFVTAECGMCCGSVAVVDELEGYSSSLFPNSANSVNLPLLTSYLVGAFGGGLS